VLVSLGYGRTSANGGRYGLTADRSTTLEEEQEQEGEAEGGGGGGGGGGRGEGDG
jgi:hypothetical protein